MKFRLTYLLLTALWLVWHALPLRAGITVQIGKNFTSATLGIDSDNIPPDTEGAVGPSNYVELINGRFSVFDKNTTSNVLTMNDGAFFTAAGVDLTGLGTSDPRVIYDPLSHRWFASEIDLDDATLVTNRFLLAVSATDDPTGVWQAVAFQADTNGNFADFPTLGLDANGVYIAANIFSPGGNLLGTGITSIPKADLLLPAPTATNRNYSGVLAIATWGYSLQPAVNFNSTNGAEAVLAVSDSGVDFLPHTTLNAFSITNAATPPALFTNPASITVPAWTVPINPTQPGGINSLDDGDSGITACVYEVGNILYAVHNTEVSGRAALQWFKVNATNRALIQSGIITDPSLEFFYPSIAADANGHVVIGCNGCSPATFISCYAFVAETIDGNTQFGAPILLKSGVATYQLVAGDGRNRWGDFSATNPDPVNPNHFWTIQEFPSSVNVWSTQITEIQVNEVLPQLSFALSGTNAVLSWPTNGNTGFSLQSNGNLATTNWVAVTNVPVVIGTNFVVTNGIAGTEFFRLKK